MASLFVSSRLAPIVSILALTGCGVIGGPSTADPPPSVTSPPPVKPPPEPGPGFPPDSPACDESISVTPGSNALIVTDQTVLQAFSLERVLAQLISKSGANTTPEEMLKRLFDTQNDAASGVYSDNAHCDDVDNRAFKNGPAVDCPRAEGKLAQSSGMFTPGNADYFAPVALVNRFDLQPDSLMTCGEQRIVFAKWSGRTDPNNRVFLIFEGSIPSPMPGSITGCRPVAELWGSLDQETDPEVISGKLEQFYFTGLPNMRALVHPNNFGVVSTDDDPYGSSKGQVRISQRMQDPWEMREFHLLWPSPDTMNTTLPNRPVAFFEPVTAKNNPMAELFDKTIPGQAGQDFRSMFTGLDTWSLGTATEVGKVRMATQNFYNGGESAVSGAASNDYMSRAGTTTDGFLADIQYVIDTNPGVFGQNCPTDDPVTAESILHRAAVQTCAGCHAPEKFIGPERKLGCGMTFPTTLGEVHIDEKGALSPALNEVFLPRRADVLQTYLQACDIGAVYGNLEPSNGKGIPK